MNDLLAVRPKEEVNNPSDVFAACEFKLGRHIAVEDDAGEWHRLVFLRTDVDPEDSNRKVAVFGLGEEAY
jgi:hypothetical protein